MGEDTPVSTPTRKRRRWTPMFAVALVITLSAAAISLSVGPTDVGVADYVQSLVHYTPSNNAHVAAREIRLPRVLLAALVGCCLATSGAVMQGVTRNALAGPSIMGLSTGGTFCLLIGLLILPAVSYNEAILLSFVGAALGYLLVCAVVLLSRGGLTPVRLALAGAVVSALFGAITRGLTIYYSMHDEMLYWTAGGIANVSWAQIRAVLPPCVVGMAGALWLAPSVTLLSLGEEVAGGLGQRVKPVRLRATLCVLLLTGGSTAVAGPVGFVGVMTPHLARLLVGVDYRRLIPMSAVLGAGLTVLADTCARTLGGGQEVPLGLFTTMIGAPFFVALARGRASYHFLQKS